MELLPLLIYFGTSFIVLNLVFVVMIVVAIGVFFYFNSNAKKIISEEEGIVPIFSKTSNGGTGSGLFTYRWPFMRV